MENEKMVGIGILSNIEMVERERERERARETNQQYWELITTNVYWLTIMLRRNPYNRNQP